MDFNGLKCGICGEEFKKGDDVVVCPDCGTPMHRACYKETGDCPNADKHGDGFVFDEFDKIKNTAQGKKKAEPSTAKTEETSVKTCPICGSKNREGANFCDNCGTRIANGSVRIKEIPTDDVDYSDPQFFASYALGQASDVPASTVYEDNVTAGDVACFVAVNTPYYLGAFKLIKAGLGKFNFSAAVFSGVWFLYRKLYRVGALLLSIEALLYALKLYFTQNLSMEIMNKLLQTVGLTVNSMTSLTWEQYMALSEEMRKLPINEQVIMLVPTILLVLQIIVMIVSGAVANKLYYKRCIEKIREVKNEAEEESLSRSETSQSLYLTGGVNAVLGGLSGFIYLLLLFM